VYCCVDAPGHELLDWLTSDTAYIRMHGRRSWYSYDYSEDELQEIAGFARRLEGAGAKKLYIYFNNDYHANAPRNAKRLIEILGASV
jgi:uncharacterized protein YecE (DUF72 family)